MQHPLLCTRFSQKSVPGLVHSDTENPGPGPGLRSLTSAPSLLKTPGLRDLYKKWSQKWKTAPFITPAFRAATKMTFSAARESPASQCIIAWAINPGPNEGESRIAVQSRDIVASDRPTNNLCYPAANIATADYISVSARRWATANNSAFVLSTLQ
jgi:hypothetical protein